jgi:hypothetical protein
MNALLKQTYNGAKEDEDSPDWEKIKSFVGGRASRDKKHPLVAEAERAQMREPEHFDEGGEAGGDFDVAGNGSSTARGTPMPGPDQGQPFDVGPLPPGLATGQGMPPIPGLGGPPPVVPRATPPAAAPPMAPSVPAVPPAAPVAPTGSDASYEAQANRALGGITPEAIQRLMQQVNTQTRKGQVGAGIAGIGDAIASVGGVKGEHMKDTEAFLKNRGEQEMKVPGAMAAAGKEQYEMGQKFQEKDPNSPLSRYAQQAYGQLGDKMGLNLRTASASLIADVTGKSVDAFKAEMEAKMKGRELNLGEKTLEQTTANEAAQRALEARGQNIGAVNQSQERKATGLQDLAKMPWWSRFLHPGVARGMKEQAGLQKPVVPPEQHPDTPRAIQWAKDNPDDPRAAQIRIRNGM